MQFESFFWLTHYGTMLYKYGKQTRDCWGVSIFSFV